MGRVEVIRLQYPQVEIFLLVIELYGIHIFQLCLSVPHLCNLSHFLQLHFLLHLCFGEIYDKEGCRTLFSERFLNCQFSLWVVGIKKNFITKGLCCFFVSFVCNSQKQIFLCSFMKLLFVPILNVQLFSTFTLGRNTSWRI